MSHQTPHGKRYRVREIRGGRVVSDQVLTEDEVIDRYPQAEAFLMRGMNAGWLDGETEVQVTLVAEPPE